MKDIVAEAVTFNLYYAGVSATERADAKEEELLPVDETTPVFTDFHFSGLTCSGAKQAIFINGLPELPLKDIEFTDCIFTANKGLEMHNAENVSFGNVIINGKEINSK